MHKSPRHSTLTALGSAIFILVASAAQTAELSAGGFRTDYHTTLQDAEANGKLALLWFFDPQRAPANERFAKDVLAQPKIAGLLADRCIVAKLPLTVEVQSGGKAITLLKHAAFHELHGQPGLAMIDMREPGSPLFRQVVTVYPFTSGAISAEHLAVLLELPRGTLTQRTLIFAVRTHPERPASSNSRFSPLLARETESHAAYQARLNLQGHHHWERRFHEINAQLPGGLIAQEVCAESWPGQNLVDAAIECVHSWRQSPGHWSAVSGNSELFGYDMKRGTNGVWYGTGIFAHRHQALAGR